LTLTLTQGDAASVFRVGWVAPGLGVPARMGVLKLYHGRDRGAAA